MDSERILTGSIVLSLVLIPIIFLKIASYLRKRKIIRLLNELAQKNNAAIHQYDQWNDSAIGLDKTKKQIFRIRSDKRDLQTQVVDLSQVNKWRVINDNSGAAYKEGYFRVTEGIEIELAGANHAGKNIVFYHVASDGPLLADELQLAEKWYRLIDEQLSNKVAGKIA